MQDQSIIDIGQLKVGRKATLYQGLIEHMFPGENYDMLLLVFKYEAEQCTFDRVDMEKVGAEGEQYLRYAYRKGSARGGDVTFTTKMGNVEKKFKTFYPLQVKKLYEFTAARKLEEDEQLWAALRRCLDQQADWVKANLREVFEQQDKKQQQKMGFSICFEEQGRRRYLADYRSIQQLVHYEGTEGKSVKHGVRSKGQHATCSICLQERSELLGFASPFKFATVDKPGLVSGFFQQRNNWKNYPICQSCAIDFEMGARYLNQYLRRSFYGKSYFIIPTTLRRGERDLLKKALTVIDDLDYTPAQSPQIEKREEYLMKKIAREGNNRFSLTLLFFEEHPTTKAIKIKLQLDELLPSRFHTLFVEIPKLINSHPLYKAALIIKKQKLDLRFSFGLFKLFFAADFYRIVQVIFIGERLSTDYLYAQFMQLIRKHHQKNKGGSGFSEPLRWLVLKAHLIIAYLQALHIIPSPQNPLIMTLTATEKNKEPSQKSSFDLEQFQQFIATNNNFFGLSTGPKVGVFAVGVLVRQVFNLQYRNLDGNTPFEKKLKGFRLNAATLKAIYIEALDKINKYTKNVRSYSGLRDVIKQYFILNSPQLERLSNDELSFYFVAGLEFGNDFKTKKSDEK